MTNQPPSKQALKAAEKIDEIVASYFCALGIQDVAQIIDREMNVGELMQDPRITYERVIECIQMLNEVGAGELGHGNTLAGMVQGICEHYKALRNSEGE